MYKIIILFFLISLQSSCKQQFNEQDQKVIVNNLLNNFHKAAANANAESYFGSFSPNAVFLGTDIKERWTLKEFKAYAQPYFDKDRGWSYKSTTRNIYFSTDGQVAWFNENLFNERFGICRGSGVLIKIENEWKIAQYNLAFAVPNSLAKQITGMIKAETKSTD